MDRRTFMQYSLAGMGGVLLSGPGSFLPAAGNKPNIILILADDLGWSELCCYGNAYNETPNLDRLASLGMRFTQAYAAAPVCSPYRASLMTGQYPARVGITDYLRPDSPIRLPTGLITVAEMLQRAGYATGIVGKWHLTGYANHGAEESPPAEHGFGETLISENRGIGGGSYFHPYHFNREIQQRLPGREHLPERCNLEAVEFIERHKDEPFFLYLSHYAVHTALAGKEELVAKYEHKPGSGKGPRASRNNPHLAAQLEVIDDGVGLIMEKLDELGLTDDTVIIFTSDNGGESNGKRSVTTNEPLRAGKSTLYEGGIREPLIIHWPSRVARGAVCHTPTITTDYYPTFLEMAGTKADPAQACDGVSLLPVLKNPTAGLPRSRLYWHYPLDKPHFLGGRSSGAIREGDWKLIEFFDNRTVELYNLAEDIGEQNNLATALPEKAARLRQQLADWRAWVR